MLFQTVICSAALIFSASAGPYPIEASWFADRWTADDWRAVLQRFKGIGGTTVWQRAPGVRVWQSAGDLIEEPSLVNCGTWRKPSGLGGNCIDEATSDLKALNITVANWLTYGNNEAVTPGVLRCPLDRVINSSRLFHRLVLPTKEVADPCDLSNQTSVNVLFLHFDGTDPHELLLNVAVELNLTVMLGAPSTPTYSGFSSTVLPSFYVFVERLLQDHARRFSAIPSYGGYYFTAEAFLGWLSPVTLQLYTRVSEIIHGIPIGKKLLSVISPYIDLNLSQVKYNSTEVAVAGHKRGFEQLINTNVDVIAVQEGRGCAKGCYYWPHQIDQSVVDVDPGLDRIVRFLDDSAAPGVTYRQQFSASNRDVFTAFREAIDAAHAAGATTEYWGNLEAFEYLRDDPCVPMDNNVWAERMDRTEKHRLDWGLTFEGALPKRFISFAFDSGFTYTGRGRTTSLADEILADFDRPIMSAANVTGNSVEVFGFNLALPGTTFTFKWTDSNGQWSQHTALLVSADSNWGRSNDRSYLLHKAVVNFVPTAKQSTAIQLTATAPTGEQSYHEVYIYT